MSEDWQSSSVSGAGPAGETVGREKATLLRQQSRPGGTSFPGSPALLPIPKFFELSESCAANRKEFRFSLEYFYKSCDLVSEVIFCP